MVLDHVLVHQDDAGALHAALGALARAGRGLVLVLLLHVGAEVGRLSEAAPAECALGPNSMEKNLACVSA